MCLAPVTLPDGLYVGCRSCWQCHKDRSNDLVGRCLAESQFAQETLAVTLTYAGDTPNASVLVYKDVQNMFKRMRKDGIKLRYIVAGEYGSQNGRAHWHCVLFLYQGQLDYEFEKRFEFKYWPHGFSYFQRPDPGGIAYVLKYAVKDTIRGSVKKSHLAMSKKPPLGYQYFMHLASAGALQGTVPRDPFYTFPESYKRDGKRVRYQLRGRMLQMYLDEFRRLYLERLNKEPFSEWFQEAYFDPIARKEEADDMSEEAEARRTNRRTSIYHQKKVQLSEPEPNISVPPFAHHFPTQPGEQLSLGFGNFRCIVWYDGTILFSDETGIDPWHLGNVKDGNCAFQTSFERMAQDWNGAPLLKNQNQFIHQLFAYLKQEIGETT